MPLYPSTTIQLGGAANPDQPPSEPHGKRVRPLQVLNEVDVVDQQGMTTPHFLQFTGSIDWVYWCPFHIWVRSG